MSTLEEPVEEIVVKQPRLTSKRKTQMAVEKGIALLDEKKPRWFEKIDLSDLAIESTRYCVLGQVFGTYTKGGVALFGRKYNEVTPDYGFERSTQSYEMLNKVWRERLAVYADLVG